MKAESYALVIQEFGRQEQETFYLSSTEFKRFLTAYKNQDWFEIKMEDGEIIKINIPFLSSIRYKTMEE